MSALARYMQYLGKDVAGYDRTPSSITHDLSELKIPIQFNDDPHQITSDFLEKRDTLIIYTPAVKRKENILLDYFLSNGYNVIKRARLLGVITQNTICLAVAGTHGKTTTSSILGHILKETNISATSFLGGIAENYNSNLILGGDKYSVVEADEFDRSFLQLKPDIACITSVDADHLDIYNNADDLVAAFEEFGALTSKKLFVKKGIPITATTFGINENADYDANNIRIEKGAYIFDVKTPKESIQNLKIYLPGQHNVLNTMAALAMANNIGVSLQNIAKALLSYKGVRRRFSYRLQSDDYILIDDYAHHPTEINAVYNVAREMYPEEEILVIFQPHLFSRTRDFEMEFVTSLAQFDEVLLLPIYPAREHPIMGITSDILVEKIKILNSNVDRISSEEIVDKIRVSNKQIILMLGAGDIGEIIQSVVEKLNHLTA
jgi:UDP-N-acetylmuramate--alanine ligase